MARGVLAARGRRPEPDPDEAAAWPAIPSRCSSDRLRALSRTPRTPVCEATTGPGRDGEGVVDGPGGAWATSSRTPRASIRRTISRPLAVSPSCSIAVRGAAEGGVEEVGRRDHPDARVGHDVHVGGVAVERVGALDREQAGRDPGVRRAVGEVGERGRRGSDHAEGPAGRRSRSRGPARRGAGRAAGGAARSTGGQRFASASVRISSLESSLRSMLRSRGVFTAIESTWSATRPSMSRGTSTWPRSPRRSRSRPKSSESAWRSATRRRGVQRACPVAHGRGRARQERAHPGLRPGDQGVQDPRRGDQRPGGCRTRGQGDLPAPAHAPKALPRVGRMRSGTL